ncbi:MAG: hypothetical protein QNJ22_01050 [Desulfosarcinaceae bacterium]|nr:hypothetical protein [Desulfosarcinaceae bacterium]
MKQNRRPRTPSYIFFYLLLSADTWRVLIGVIIAVALTPRLAEEQALGRGAAAVLALMLVAVGWWISAWPMNKWTALLRNWIRSLQ